MNVADKRIVSIHYKLTDDGGNEIDSSSGGDPLDYLHGADNIVPGLERELTGKSAGDQVQVVVQPADGYGPVHDELVQKLEREVFQGVDEIEPGMQFEAKSPDGDSRVVTVKEVSDDGITVDANHPLAGVTLHFDVTVESVREATEEELAHGHAH
jgi:FKBP-type peptidyl-prolyl cis-trans isomerase SlyD